MAACIANLPGTSMELISMATASVLAIGQVDRPPGETRTGEQGKSLGGGESGAALLQESRPRMPRRNGRERPVNHPKRSGSLVRNRIIDECQRTEPGIDGLARTNLRFSSQGAE